MPGVVSVASPASRYFEGVLRAVAAVLGGASRVLVVASESPFGRAVARGAVDTAAELGLTAVGVVAHDAVPDDADADVLVIAGSLRDDCALLMRLRRRPPVVAAVGAALGEFADAVGPRAEGVFAPSQWEEGLRTHADVGPPGAAVVRALRARLVPRLSSTFGVRHVEYPAAQAYASVLVALRCVDEVNALDDAGLLKAARRLRCTTFFGRFGLAADGRQGEHEMVVVQWRAGTKRVVWPPSMAEAEVVVRS
jgi:branched-chain amino acid transport system substrate-binding protein